MTFLLQVYEVCRQHVSVFQGSLHHVNEGVHSSCRDLRTDQIRQKLRVLGKAASAGKEALQDWVFSRP